MFSTCQTQNSVALDNIVATLATLDNRSGSEGLLPSQGGTLDEPWCKTDPCLSSLHQCRSASWWVVAGSCTRRSSSTASWRRRSSSGRPTGRPWPPPLGHPSPLMALAWSPKFQSRGESTWCHFLSRLSHPGLGAKKVSWQLIYGWQTHQGARWAVG